MKDRLQIDELAVRTGRMMRYRIPLVLVVAVNCFLVARIPWASMKAKPAPPPKKVAKVNPKAKAAPAPTKTRPENNPPVEVEPTESNPEVTTSENPFLPNPIDPNSTDPNTAENPFIVDPLTSDPFPSLEIDPNDLPPSPYPADPPVVVIPGETPDTYPGGHETPSALRVGATLNSLADAAQWWSLNNPEEDERDPFATMEQPEIPAELVIQNPADNQGAVHFLFNGEVFSLEAGESRQLPHDGQRRIEYHRGGEFGVAQQELEVATYEFRVTDGGWNLRTVEASQP